MKQVLSENDKDLLEKRIAEVEKLSKTQIVLATVRRSDCYREIPWKAFALGTSAAGFLVLSFDLIFPGWLQITAVIISIVATLAIGAFIALLTILLPDSPGCSFRTAAQKQKLINMQNHCFFHGSFLLQNGALVSFSSSAGLKERSSSFLTKALKTLSAKMT